MNKKQYLLTVCLISTLGGFLFGYDTAVISGTLSFVRTQFSMSALLEGWFVGSALLGCVIGVSFAGVLSDFSGRKKTLLLSALFMAVSAAGCMVSANLTILIIYRLIGGLGVGIASMLSPLYISEVSPPETRGRIVSLYQFAITIGILVAYFANTRILAWGSSLLQAENGFLKYILSDEAWRGMFGSEIIPAGIFFLLLFLIPESPRWLMAKGREEKASLVLLKFVNQETAGKEIDDIKKVLAKETGDWRQMFQPGVRFALILGILLAVFSQFTGINAVIYYGPKIFEAAGFGVGNSLNSQVLIGVINVLFTIIAIWKIDTFGRRKLLLIGSGGMMLSHVAIGILFKTGYSNGPLLIIFILSFIAFFAASYGPVIWTLLSEMYPTHVRGRAMSIATLSLWLGTYVIGQTVPWLFENLQPYGTFWLFAAMCVIPIVIIIRWLPETKQLSLEEIEQHWFVMGKKSK